MKNKKNNEEKATKPGIKKNYWKILSICFIIIIIGIFLVGAFRAYTFRHAFVKTNSEDITLAKGLVADYYNNKSINFTYENIMVKEKKITTPDGKTIIEASIIGENKRESFMIDLNSKQIIMHEYMENFVPFPEHGPRGFFGKRDFDRK